MTQEHPITPPPELVEQWRTAPEYASALEKLTMVTMTDRRLQEIASQAARWGADQELEACCEWLVNEGHEYEHVALRAARRPKPRSLKEQALEAAQRFYANGHENCTEEEVKDDFDTIRRALEQLDD